MSCAASAIRLTARSVSTAPSRSTTRADGRPKRALAQQLERDEFALLRAAAEPLGDEEFARRAALLDRQHAAGAVLELAIDAEHAPARPIEDFDDPAAVGGIARPASGSSSTRISTRAPMPGAGADSRRSRGRGPECAAARRAVPLDRAGDQLAVAVALDDVGDHHRRQRALAREDLAAARDRAFGFEVLQQQTSARPCPRP